VVHLVGNNLPLEPFRLFARFADPARVSLTIGSLDREGPLQEGLREVGIPTFAIGADRRASYPKAVARIARLLRHERADVLQAHLFEACVVGLTSGRLARVPVNIFTAHHSHEIPLHDRRLLTLTDRLAAGPLSDAVIAPSTSMRDTLVRVHQVRPEKIVVIPPLGLDLTVFNPDRVSGDAFRARHDIDSKVVFGAVSRYFWVKNLGGLVRGFSKVIRDESEAKLVIVGPGDRAELQRLVDELGLTDDVLLLGPVKDVAGAYAALDVLVHPALAESFGQVIVEAMAMGKPVVSTSVGIAEEIIEDGVSGFAAQSPEPSALAEAMTAALRRRADWAAIGREARNRAMAFTAERWVAAHMDAYERWAAAAAAGAQHGPRRLRR
jgi:glycosyltransferase involved in cell wall biosynthesis